MIRLFNPMHLYDKLGSKICTWRYETRHSMSCQVLHGNWPLVAKYRTLHPNDDGMGGVGFAILQPLLVWFIQFGFCE